jgi:hypothetical protein
MHARTLQAGFGGLPDDLEVFEASAAQVGAQAGAASTIEQVAALA